jgi:hypothetical protein
MVTVHSRVLANSQLQSNFTSHIRPLSPLGSAVPHQSSGTAFQRRTFTFVGLPNYLRATRTETLDSLCNHLNSILNCLFLLSVVHALPWERVTIFLSTTNIYLSGGPWFWSCLFHSMDWLGDVMIICIAGTALETPSNWGHLCLSTDGYLDLDVVTHLNRRGAVTVSAYQIQQVSRMFDLSLICFQGSFSGNIRHSFTFNSLIRFSCTTIAHFLLVERWQHRVWGFRYSLSLCSLPTVHKRYRKHSSG